MDLGSERRYYALLSARRMFREKSARTANKVDDHRSSDNHMRRLAPETEEEGSVCHLHGTFKPYLVLSLAMQSLAVWFINNDEYEVEGLLENGHVYDMRRLCFSDMMLRTSSSETGFLSCTGSRLFTPTYQSWKMEIAIFPIYQKYCKAIQLEIVVCLCR